MPRPRPDTPHDAARDPSPGDAPRPPEGGRPRLSFGDVVRLVLRTYRATLPLFLVFLAGLVLATWIVTTVLFR